MNIDLTANRGATSFLVVCMKKTRPELQAILTDDARLNEAAAFHNIKPEWARFWITEESNRNDRRN
jgi:hypothetical protein